MNELACIEKPEAKSAVLPIRDIDSMDSYLQNYGAILGKKAIHALAPLHIPDRDPLPDFSDVPEWRQPFGGQPHVIAAQVKMFDKVGSGFVCGEMGTGKTLIGILSIHKHAQRSRHKGGSGGKYRSIVLCPDHLIGKWCREIEETLPDAIVTRFGPQGSVEEDVEKPANGRRRKKGEPKPDTNTRATLRDVVALLTCGGDSSKAVKSKTSAGVTRELPVSTGPDTFEMRPCKPSPTSGTTMQRGRQWSEPKGAEWFVLGRNQAKWLSDWSGLADQYNGFRAAEGALCEIARTALVGRDADGNPITETTQQATLAVPVKPQPFPVSSKTVVVDKVNIVNEKGWTQYDNRGRPLTKNVTGRVFYCPRCGGIIRDKKGVPLGAAHLKEATKGSMQQVCKGTFLQMKWSGPDTKSHGLDRIPIPVTLASVTDRIGHAVKHGGYNWTVTACGEPLYNYTSRPFRWSPARIIQNKCRSMFKYLVIDEVHEQKSDSSAQSMACSKLIGSARHVLALTGTVIGGYANHLFPLLMRISPRTLRDEGFQWGKDMAFSEAYGKIDHIVTTKEEGSSFGVTGRSKSMRRAKSGSRTEQKQVRPGVMPTMFGRHMIGCCTFITLDEMSDELPDLFEYVGGGIGSEPSAEDFAGDKDHTAQEQYEHALDTHNRAKDGWFDVACSMEPEQEAEYGRVMACLEFANTALLRKGSMKLLGTYLWTGLDYPDRPFGWGHDPDYLKAVKKAQDEGQENVNLGYTVGYWDKPGDKTFTNFVGVVTPADCPESTIFPKEQRLIDICLKQKKDGRQTWVYVQMTGKRNIQPRLKSLLEASGLKVGVLRSTDVEPIEREEWIRKHGRDFDVMISHPQLVSTGLDLFSKEAGGHNYSTLVFYETGYNLFTMRQAARRAWRIGQPNDCRVYYMYYRETMQHKAMTLMSKKMSAAQALEGEFSEEGLAAMAGEDNLQMALAKNLSNRIDDSDMQRGWSKVRSGPKKVKRPTAAVGAMTKGVKPSPLDDLPIEIQIVAATMIDNQGKPIPDAARAEFPRLAAAVAGHESAFADFEAWEDSLAEQEAEESGIEDEFVMTEEQIKHFRERAIEFDDTFDDEPETAKDDEFVMTEEQLHKMFANMLANGLEVA